MDNVTNNEVVSKKYDKREDVGNIRYNETRKNSKLEVKNIKTKGWVAMENSYDNTRCKWSNPMLDSFLTPKQLEVKNLLVRNEELQARFEMFLTDEDTLEHPDIALNQLRRHILKQNYIQDSNLKMIEQAYKSKQQDKLKTLVQETFLQIFNKKDFDSFIELFENSNLTWFELFNKFKKYKCDVSFIIQNKSM